MKVVDVLLKKYPQLIGEIDLLRYQTNDWDIVLSEQLSQVKYDKAFKELLKQLRFSEIEESIEILINFENNIDRPQPLTKTASLIERKQPNWLIPNVLLESSVHLLAGEPKAGKSYLSCYVGASISAGKECFGVPQEEGKVIYFAQEDEEGYIVDRLYQQGANLENIEIQQMGQDFELPDQHNKIAFEIARTKPKLVVIDVINNYMTGKTNTNNDKELRVALKPLVMLSKFYGVPILCLHHLNKANTSNHNHRINGSIGYQGVSRCVWFMANKPDSNEKIMSITATNYGVEKNFSFELEEIPNQTPRMLFKGETEEKAYEIQSVSDIDKDEVVECADEIINLLEESGGIQGSTELRNEILKNYNEYIYKKARKYLAGRISKDQKNRKHYTLLVDIPKTSELMNL